MHWTWHNSPTPHTQIGSRLAIEPGVSGQYTKPNIRLPANVLLEIRLSHLVKFLMCPCGTRALSVKIVQRFLHRVSSWPRRYVYFNFDMRNSKSLQILLISDSFCIKPCPLEARRLFYSLCSLHRLALQVQ